MPGLGDWLSELMTPEQWAAISGPGVQWQGGENIVTGLAKIAMAPGQALQSTTPITTEEMIKPAGDIALATMFPAAGTGPEAGTVLTAGMRRARRAPTRKKDRWKISCRRRWGTTCRPSQCSSSQRRQLLLLQLLPSHLPSPASSRRRLSRRRYRNRRPGRKDYRGQNLPRSRPIFRASAACRWMKRSRSRARSRT